MKTEKEIASEVLNTAHENFTKACIMEKYYQRKEIMGDKAAKLELMTVTAQKKANQELIDFLNQYLATS